MITLVK